MNFKRFYRFDFAVTQVLNEKIDKYYGIVISAHILTYTPRSVVQILNETRKPFFIDPMTFVFARDIDNISRNGKIRKSYRKLIDEYGTPFTKTINGLRLSPSDFKDANGDLDDSIIAQASRRVLDCQINKCVVSADFRKYDRLLKKGISPSTMKPSFLVAPYFYINRTDDDWYEISLRFSQIANEIKGESELYPVICISGNIIWDQSQISKIIRDYEGFDGYLLWVNNFNEQKLTSNEINGIKSLIAGLSASGKPVYSLYGGYLCDLLSKFGLNGYSSGICYGEKRSVDTRGGGAGNRYYIPTVHLKISDGLANAFFSESDGNRRLLCSCPTCAGIRDSISGSISTIDYVDAFFARMDFLDFRRHFVDIKFNEMRELESLDVTGVKNSLENDISEIMNIDGFSGQPEELDGRNLRIWLNLFNQNI